MGCHECCQIFQALFKTKDAYMSAQVIKTDLFRVLKEKLGPNLHGLIQDKVFPVAGDIACDSLGINFELKDDMCSEIDIIVNSAATTRFDERYDTAIRINALGAMNIIKFSKQCLKLKMLLHVSTAYVCGEKKGLILEKPLNYGQTLNGSSRLEIEVEQKLVEEALKDLQDRNATEKEVTLAMRVLGIDRTMDTFIVGYGKGNLNVGMADRESMTDVILKWENLILCQHLQDLHTDLERRINHAIRLAELYRSYLFFKGVFDDTNAEMLRMATRKSNADDTFNFDPTTIQWEKYFKEIHIPGVVKYLF
ncbi:probable fatty acyl-CoA reductase 4 [Lycium ferocissimum]|uniref:probable fatty acyl-CoA reductase 4 n=1 Tax=Lycium ferocissimum TaxID=112874 RepID=UPI002816345F|nr:probable fatty acyl-CoA reductase 4 [Lycium ferocissimum]